MATPPLHSRLLAARLLCRSRHGPISSIGPWERVFDTTTRCEEAPPSGPLCAAQTKKACLTSHSRPPRYWFGGGQS